MDENKVEIVSHGSSCYIKLAEDKHRYFETVQLAKNYCLVEGLLYFITEKPTNDEFETEDFS